MTDTPHIDRTTVALDAAIHGKLSRQAALRRELGDAEPALERLRAAHARALADGRTIPSEEAAQVRTLTESIHATHAAIALIDEDLVALREQRTEAAIREASVAEAAAIADAVEQADACEATVAASVEQILAHADRVQEAVNAARQAERAVEAAMGESRPSWNDPVRRAVYDPHGPMFALVATIRRFAEGKATADYAPAERAESSSADATSLAFR